MKRNQNQYSNKQIAHLLRSIASAYLLKEENRFKIIAYENAASSIERLEREVRDVWEEGKLTQIPGIGAGIESHLDEYFRTSRSKHFEEILKGIPETVFELMKVPTLGPKRAFRLVKALKLFNKKTLIKDLKQAVKVDKIAELPNFGEKSQEEISKAVATYEKKNIKEERMPLPYAFSIAKNIVEYLKRNSKIKRVDVLGSLRRMTATIGDIDIAVSASTKDTRSVIDYFTNYPKKISVDNAGGKKASIIVYPYVRVDLRIQEEETYGSMLQYFTGSKTHNIQLREYALKKDYSLSEYGIKKVKSQKSKVFDTEKKFYNFLALQYIPPEIREGRDEIKIAEKQELPNLVKLSDIKGDLHTHSNYDLNPSHDLGEDSYLDIAKKAKQLGYEYIGFSEHNPGISNNNQDKIISIMKARKDYIDKIFSSQKIEHIQYLVGLEVDILPTGKLALPERAAEYVDYLIVSIHSSFNLDTQAMTNRVLRGLQNPKVKIFGHPIGRLFSKREGYTLEWDKIFDTCRRRNIALEINASTDRLDLPDILVYEAIKNKVKLVINSDAHATTEMENLAYGVSVARRGWAKKGDIINTESYQEVKKWITKA